MATIRRIFSYDSLEDKDIHEFLERIPPRQRSKHIRMAIKLYMKHLSSDMEIFNTQNERTETERESDLVDLERTETERESNLVDLDEDFLDNLGK